MAHLILETRDRPERGGRETPGDQAGALLPPVNRAREEGPREEGTSLFPQEASTTGPPPLVPKAPCLRPTVYPDVRGPALSPREDTGEPLSGLDLEGWQGLSILWGRKGTGRRGLGVLAASEATRRFLGPARV